METLDHIKKISINLEKFSNIIATKEPEMDMLIGDAHQTMQSINQAAQTVDKALKDLGTEGGNLGELKETLDQAGQAAQKVDDYVTRLEQISFHTALGAGYANSDDLTVDYLLNIKLNERNSLIFRLEDIGQQNLATFQWGIKKENLLGRAGIYRNEFGLGLDYPLSPKTTLGLDLWNTESPNFGLTSNWILPKDWSMSLSTSTNIETNENYWSLEWWHHF